MSFRNFICTECGTHFVALTEVDKCRDCSTAESPKETPKGKKRDV